MTDIVRLKVGDHLEINKYNTDKFKCENISIYLSVKNEQRDSVKRSLLLSVLKHGTVKYPTQKLINERLDELYASLVNLKNQKFEATQLLGVSADIINSSYTQGGEDLLFDVLEVVSQMLFHPLLDEKTGMFCEDFVNLEKSNYKSIVQSQINEPNTYAAMKCREEMFSSLGIMDSLDTIIDKIDKTTTKELYECYLDIVKSAKIVVFYIGARDLDDLREKLENAFGGREFELAAHGDKGVKLLDYVDSPKEIVEDRRVSQSRLVIGLNCRVISSDDDYYAMLLCNEILGASPISKLMMNVREKYSLCYECDSVYNSARGAFFINSGIDADNFELAKGAIFNELEDMKNGNITSLEFGAAKKSLKNAYLSASDSPAFIERFYLGRIINKIDIDISTFIEKIEKLTMEDVVRAANKLTPHIIYFLRGTTDDGEGEYDE